MDFRRSEKIQSFISRSSGRVRIRPQNFALADVELIDREIDVPALFLSVVANEFVNHLARYRPSLVTAYSRRKDVDANAGVDVFELYRRTLDLKAMHDAYNKA